MSLCFTLMVYLIFSFKEEYFKYIILLILIVSSNNAVILKPYKLYFQNNDPIHVVTNIK